MTDNFTIDDYLKEPVKIAKPIRLIELFAGYGSQALALKRLGVNYTSYRVIEWDKYAMASYNAVHGTSFETSDIKNIHAEDLGIVDKDKFCYILTYSFPCQDISQAGLKKGFEKGSGTRSGLLWEVERLLNECTELPQVLLMENVPAVVNSKNIKDFQLWRSFLEDKGYSCYVQILNAKDYGVPQNRERCFMVSILGDYSYSFPKPIERKMKLKDVLEEQVEEKYYLNNDKANRLIDKLIADESVTKGGRTTVELTMDSPKEIDNAHAILSRYDAGVANKPKYGTGVFETIKIKQATQKGYIEMENGGLCDMSYESSKLRRGRVQEGGTISPAITTNGDCIMKVDKCKKTE